MQEQRAQRLFRVQGGINPNRSKKYLKITKEQAAERGRLFCPTLSNIYVGDHTHMMYFLKKRLNVNEYHQLPTDISEHKIEVVEMHVPYWYTYLLEKYSIQQYKSGSKVYPKLVDRTTPGKSYQLKGGWSKLLENSNYKAETHEMNTKNQVIEFLLSTPNLTGEQAMQNSAVLPYYLKRAEVHPSDMQNLTETWSLDFEEPEFVR